MQARNDSGGRGALAKLLGNFAKSVDLEALETKNSSCNTKDLRSTTFVSSQSSRSNIVYELHTVKFLMGVKSFAVLETKASHPRPSNFEISL